MDEKETTKKLLEEIEKNPSKIGEILETKYTERLNKEAIIEYNQLKNKISTFKQELIKISKEVMMIDKIKKIKASGQDGSLEEGPEKRIYDNIQLISEKQTLIIHIIDKISQEKLILNEICPNFQEYVLSNFYRTFCELPIRLLTETLLIMVDYNLSLSDKDKEYYSAQEKYKRSIMNNSFGLDDLRAIFGDFDKRLAQKIGLVKMIDKYFLYKDGEGFSLRNKIAHEKIFFKEININKLKNEILRLNMLTRAILKIFFFDELEKLVTKEDLIPAKNRFGDIIS